MEDAWMHVHAQRHRQRRADPFMARSVCTPLYSIYVAGILL
jgi:hypothetical protein